MIWILLKDDGDESDVTVQGIGPKVVTVQELQDLATSSDTPVYWAGNRKGLRLELTKTDSGRVYVRYVPANVAPGDTRPNFLAVATYPESNGYFAVRVAGQEKGASAKQIPGGGLLVSKKKATSVHFSYPGAAYQVEVFDPTPDRARRLVLAGDVQRVRHRVR